jgi:preprotein translocase subunit SecB
MNPPLIVREYFFPFIQVAADAEFDPSKGIPKINFETKVKVEKKPQNGIYQVALEIIIMPENETEKIPYSIDLVTVGLFSVSEAIKDPEKLLRITGASILYSAAREFLITLTARGPWQPPVFLPTVSFIPPEEPKPETINKPKKKKPNKIQDKM